MAAAMEEEPVLQEEEEEEMTGGPIAITTLEVLLSTSLSSLSRLR